MPIQRPQPIADQVKTVLQKRIRDLIYPPGSRLPSESDLSQELGVSRATLRTVLAKLAAEGLILRKQGDGTYVNERMRDVDTRYGGVWDFSRIIASNGFKPSIRTDSLVYRPASIFETEKLGIPAEAEVVALVRTFSADDQPVIITTNVIPADLLKEKIQKGDGQLPIHQIMRKYCLEQIAYAISDIEAIPAEPEFEPLFARPIPYPLLKLTETFFSRNNQPLVFGQSLYDHRKLRLRLVQPWG